MRGLSPDERQQHADRICGLVRGWITDPDSHVELELERGMEWRPDLRTGARSPRPNGTFTLVLRINGGARDTEGHPEVPAPIRVHGPEH